MANTRLVMNVEMESGNHTVSIRSAPELWQLLERLAPHERPALIRVTTRLWRYRCAFRRSTHQHVP
jgi:hypothetical protein